MKTIWIAWEEHRRTKELASHYGVMTFILTSKLPRLIKHPLLIIKTVNILIRKKPDLVFIQNPSIILAVVCCILKPCMGFKLVSDLHNAAVVPEKIWQKLLYFLYRYVHKKSDINIVTNRKLKEKLGVNSLNSVVLPDKLPYFKQKYVRPDIVKDIPEYFVSICTFGIDEPFDQIIESARMIDKNIKIIVTGNFNRCPLPIRSKKPDNVLLSGFLPEESYINLLYFSKGIIDLTKRDDCLVCGAYEAVALEKPLILSSTTALKEYFNNGVEFCSNDKYSISEAIKIINDNCDYYTAEIKKLKRQLEQDWCISDNIIKDKLSAL